MTTIHATKTDYTLWGIREVAQFLRVAEGSIYHWVGQQRIPFIRFSSRCLRFDPAEIEKWAASHSTSKSETERETRK